MRSLSQRTLLVLVVLFVMFVAAGDRGPVAAPFASPSFTLVPVRASSTDATQPVTDEGAAGGALLGESGKFGTAYNLYESKETVLLLADPRARKDYVRQDATGASDATEKAQCRRCEWPSYLPDPATTPPSDPALANVKELLAGGEDLRVFLSPDPSKPASDPARVATEAALVFFHTQADNDPAPAGSATLAGWADEIPSPIQASLAEPAQNPAYWSPNEAGVSISLVAGDAILSTSDFWWQGRALPLSLDRTYRSGTLGYGPLGSAGWSSPLFAHLREIGTTGEVEYHDGRGNVFRFLPPGTPPPAGYEADQPSTYVVPQGLYLRLRKVGLEQGWQLFDRHHNVMTFDAEGKLVEIADRHRQGAAANRQGNTIRFHHDVFGQLLSIEDDYGRTYAFDYYDNPKPIAEGGDGIRYGLLKRVTDFAGRTIEYEWDEQRRLINVKLPEVSNPVGDYASYSYTGASRPTIQYRYNPATNVSPSDTSSTAILHGAYAPLRLEGFVQPGSTVLRARFEYDATTGRVTKVGFPTPAGTNDPTSSVAWTIAYPNEPASAVPATKATVTAPWGHVTEQATELATDQSRVVTLTEKWVETLAFADPTPDSDKPIAQQDLTTTYHYLSDGRLDHVTRADGGATAISYPSAKGADRLALTRPTQVKRDGATFTLDYVLKQASSTPSCPGSMDKPSPDNLPVSITDPLGRERLVPSPNLTDPGSSTPMPAPSGVCADGIGAVHAFDTFGRTKTITSQSSGTDKPPLTLTLTYGAKPTTRDGAGFLSKIESDQDAVSLIYDEAGNVAQATSALGSSLFVHDAWDRQCSVTLGIGTGRYKDVSAKVQRAYDAAGRLLRERAQQTGAGWVETRIAYNARDQVTTITQTQLAAETPGGSLREGTTSFAFDTFGRVTSATSPGQVVTAYTYDSASRVTKTKVGDGGEQRRLYDQTGHVVFTTDGHEGVWRGLFDTRGRLVQENLPSGAVVERAYDDADGLTRETAFANATKGDANKLEETLYTPTAFGAFTQIKQLIKAEQQPTGSDQYLVTDYAFDPAARIVKIARGPSTGSPRDELRRVFEADTGRLLKEFDAAGNWNEYVYEGMLRVPTRVTRHEMGPGASEALQLATSLTYDALGRAISEEQGGTRTERTLDERGNVLAQSTGDVGFQATYDRRGLPLTLSRAATGLLAAYGYDLDGRVRFAQTPRQSPVATEQTEYRYDASGRLATRILPNSVQEAFSYFPDGLLKQATTRSGLSLSYTYDPANRLTAIIPSGTPSAPSRLAPLDAGDAYAYDPLSHPTLIAHKTGPADADVDPTSKIAYAEYDLRGLPRYERVGTSPTTGQIERTFDAFGSPGTTLLPASAASAAWPGALRCFDALDRVTSTRPTGQDCGAVTTPGVGASYSWGGQERLLGTITRGGLQANHGFTYSPDAGRLATETIAAASGHLGSFTFGWDPARDAKTARLVLGARNVTNLASRLDWAWQQDAALRLTHAQLGFGGTGTRAMGDWALAYGRADELLFAEESHAGVEDYQPAGLFGRIEQRQGAGDPVRFVYDLEGRRIEDERFLYTWDWRGKLVQVDVKDPQPPLDRTGRHAAVEVYAGEQLRYRYDALGRLLSRTELGKRPASGQDSDRPFVAKRTFVWDGDALAAESGLNFQDEVIWKEQYVPGPRGLDDAPQVHVETGIGGGAPTDTLYALLRDELGSVIGVAEDKAPVNGTAPLLARYLYTPYGEAHLEAGPELLSIAFDPNLTQVGGQTQSPPVKDTSVGGGVRVRTTIALDPATWPAGVVLEEWNAVKGTWDAAARADWAIAADPNDASVLLLVRLAGYPKSTTYRITLKPTLADAFGRAIQLPAKEAGGVEIVLDVPSDGNTPPSYAREFPFVYDITAAASNTLCRPVGTTCEPRFPGGMNHLWQGAWTDPITGLSYHRSRWYSGRDATWLSEDPVEQDSPNLFAALAWQPETATDPMGLSRRTANGGINVLGDYLNDAEFTSDMAWYQRWNAIAADVVGNTVSDLLMLDTIADTAAIVGDASRTTGARVKAGAVGLGVGALDVAGGEIMGTAGKVLTRIPGVKNVIARVGESGVGRFLSRDVGSLFGKRGTRIAEEGFENAMTAEVRPKSAIELRNGPGIATWNEFQQATAGRFTSRAEAGVGWSVYKESNRATRTLVIGRLADTEAAELAGFQRLKTGGWTPAVNDIWVQGGIDAGRPFKLVSPVNRFTLFNPPGSRFPTTIFSRELHQLKRAGYTIRGGWAMPPGW